MMTVEVARDQGCWIAHLAGYRTKRVGLSPTFRLCGARKSGSKLLGANFEGGQNVLVKCRLFGFVVRESGRQSWYWQIR